MNTELDKLRADYLEMSGRPFDHFFCPILWTDEDTERCMGHIVNEAFPDSPRDKVVQRKDVDGFYGSCFESDFVAWRYSGYEALEDVVIDKALSDNLDPQILIDGKPVPHYKATGDVPAQHTQLNIEKNGKFVQLGLKLTPEQALAAADQDWEIAVTKDVRVPAMVSLIKSAHLTLFSILGYRYGLSSSGHHIGREIMGDFYLQNRGKKKRYVKANALPYFREYGHLVRPLALTPGELQGTITDKVMLTCQVRRERPWAVVVFVNVMQTLHAVMVPLLEDDEGAKRYTDFLKNDTEQFTARWSRFQNSQWELDLDENIRVVSWPKTGTLYP